MSEHPLHDQSERWPRAVTLVAVVAAPLLLGLPGLGSGGLVRMEGMVAAIAQEMIVSGELAVARLYGELYTYKPPLLYWLVAGLFGLLGAASEWALRLPSVLATASMCGSTYVLVARVAGPRVGTTAGLAAFSGVLFLEKFRVAEFDAPLAAFVGIAVAAACRALADRHRPDGSIAAWCVCYLALAAALLTKGGPALMSFAPGLLLAAFVTGRARSLVRPPHLLAAALFAAIGVAYVGWAYAHAGWAAFAQPLDEARLRGAQWSLSTFARTWSKPLLIVPFFLPWSVLLSDALRRFEDAAVDRLARAAWAFLLGGTVAFMCVPTHESRYYLPLAVPVAILASLALGRAEAGRWRWSHRLACWVAALVAAATLGLGLAAGSVVTTPPIGTMSRLLLVLIGAATLGLSLRSWKRRDTRLTSLLLLTSLCFWAAETRFVGPRRASTRDQRPAALQLAPSVPETDTLWTLGPAGSAGKYSSLLYYLGRRVRTFDAEEGPPPGAICVLRAVDVEKLSNAQLDRLQPLAEATDPRWRFGLYRAGPRTASAPACE